MQDFIIAAVQHSSPVGRWEKNLKTTMLWAKRAKNAGANLVLFPELNITGHAGHPEMIKHAQPVPGGEIVHRLSSLAEELDLYICAGVAEDQSGIHYNTQFIVGPEGYIGKQRKVHLSSDEYFYFRAGTALPVFDLPFARIGIVICSDNGVPEVSRCLAVKGVEVLCCPHAARVSGWSADRSKQRQIIAERKSNWRLVHCCRAYDNGVYVALCNTTGMSAVGLRGVQANHIGGCMVIDPYGKVIGQSRSKDTTDEMLIAELKAQPLSDSRCQQCFNLQTRRPEVFKVLCDPTE